jgi:serine-type D-Ala-D-Ala carboxypeptidase (penicillin-binding protein 5/6)
LRVAARLFAVVAIFLTAAAAVFVAVQLLRPVPAVTVTFSAAQVRVLPGIPPRPQWAGQAEAVVGMPGLGVVAAHGGSRPVPIASLAKKTHETLLVSHLDI